MANKTLDKYRQETQIIDDSINSIYNLISHLGNKKEFIRSYIEFVRDYKVNNHDIMSKEEREFYQAINNYYDEEVIHIPSSDTVDEFDKSMHRGMKLGKTSLETRTSDKNLVILIPSDIDNTYMRVAVK